jgi:hypothetical protein
MITPIISEYAQHERSFRLGNQGRIINITVGISEIRFIFVKVYPQGIMTQFFNSLNIGDHVEVRGKSIDSFTHEQHVTDIPTGPKGKFSYKFEPEGTSNFSVFTCVL